MKNLSTKLLAVLAIGVLFCQQAQAVPISGQVDMVGTTKLDNADLALATAASFPAGTFQMVALGTGDYTGTEGSSVTWSDFSWIPPSTPEIPLWTFMSGGLTYAFDLLTLTVVSQSSTFLNLTGSGIVTISGGMFDPTPGTWSFTIVDTGGPNSNMRFVFGSSTSGVPEGGATLALLGLGLVGVELLRRKLRTA